MGGLAAGAWLAGRFPPRPDRRLHTYAALEIVIALLALAIPVALPRLPPLLQWAYSDVTHCSLQHRPRCAESDAAWIAAAAMGATFPLVVAWLADAGDKMRRGSNARTAADASILYAMNTAGAALAPSAPATGDSSGGPSRDVMDRRQSEYRRGGGRPLDCARRRTCHRTAGTRKRRRASHENEAPPVLFTATGTDARASPRARVDGSRAVGFAGLVYEVIWARLLALVIGPTTYAFATMAAVFISGIAIGSAAGASLARRVSRPGLWLAAMLVANGRHGDDGYVARGVAAATRRRSSRSYWIWIRQRARAGDHQRRDPHPADERRHGMHLRTGACHRRSRTGQHRLGERAHLRGELARRRHGSADGRASF
jgi:spermidine synthase